MNRTLVVCAALAILAAPAFAAEAIVVASNPPVVVPAVPPSTVWAIQWGDAVAAIANTVTAVILPALVTGIGLVLSKLYPPLRMMITDKLVEDTLRKWLDYGLNQVEGHVKGQAMNVDVGSAVIAQTLNRATSRAAVNELSKWALDKAGGEVEVANKLSRMLTLDEHTTATEVVNRAIADTAVAKV